MKRVGRVDIPQEAFLAVLKVAANPTSVLWGGRGHPLGPSARDPWSRLSAPLQRNIPMLFAWHGIGFIRQHPQSPNHFGPRFMRFNHVVHIATLGGHERIREMLAVLVDLRLPGLLRIARALQFAPIQKN